MMCSLLEGLFKQFLQKDPPQQFNTRRCRMRRGRSHKQMGQSQPSLLQLFRLLSAAAVDDDDVVIKNRTMMIVAGVSQMGTLMNVEYERDDVS